MHFFLAFIFSIITAFAQAEDHYSNFFNLKTTTNSSGMQLNWDINNEHYLLASKFKITPLNSKQFSVSELPTPTIIKDDFLGEISVYTNKLSLLVKPIDGIKTNIDFSVEYQGCTTKSQCYPSITKNFSIPPPQIKLNETDKIASILQQDNIFWILISFFGFGLLLSLTPCVFPMIPILSGIIVGHKGEVTTRKALIMSIVFVLAMSVTYAIAGVLAGYFGENLQVLFQTPWILITFSLVFIALAFSMFGYYEIQLPKALQDKIANMSNKQEGGHLIGVVIMGFLSALIVGPCVAPPLAGALIYIGQTGDALLGGLSLFVMSLGMGAPLIVIGTGVSHLPKAGMWMNNVKYVFGILMLAVAIWLLDRILDPLTSLILWALLFTISPIAMGVLTNLKSASSPLVRIYKAIGLIILGYGVLLFILVSRGGGDMLQPLAGWGSSESQQEQKHIAFAPVKSISELNVILSKSRADNQIVMLDFYADWCISCKELERFVFSNSKVVSAMSNVVSVQADVTQNNDDDKALMSKFGVIGPPAILFFKNGKDVRSYRIIGEINVDGFLKAFNSI
jgi:thiol:disulfide interchange protein DsbD